MYIDNPLQMNDWGIRRFLVAVAVIQLLMLALIELQLLNINVPVLREITGFIYLTIVPGALMLRIMRLHRLGAVEGLLYTVGLSVAFQMFLGLLVNAALPHIGVATPLSLASLTVATAVAVVLLSIFCYIRDRHYTGTVKLDIGEVVTPPALFLLLLIPLTILGALMVNHYLNSFILWVVVLLIAVVPVLVVFNKFIPARLYPLAVFTIGIALLYHRSLISPYLVGWDIHTEYYVAKFIEAGAYWNPRLAYSVGNSLLSLTILPQTYAQFLAMEMTGVFKVAYPLLFSIVPLGLYRLFRQWHDEKTSFLSVFFFVSMIFFFTSLLALARQEIAEVFLILLILLIFNGRMPLPQRAVLTVVFGAAMVVSHYAITYIYGFYILSCWAIAIILKRFITRGATATPPGDMAPNSLNRSLITFTGVALFLVLAYAWYIYVTQGGAFTVLVEAGSHIGRSMIDFLEPSSRDFEVLMFLGYSPVLPSVEREIFRILSYITQLFIAIGVISSIAELTKHRRIKFEPEFLGMVIVSLIILGATVVLPFFASSLGMTRFYHLALFFLSPFCITGGQLAIRWLASLLRRPLPEIGSPVFSMAMLVILLPYFLFNIGFVYEVTGDSPTSISLSLGRMRASEHPIIQVGVSNDYIYEQESASGVWLADNMDNVSKIYADNINRVHVLTSRALITQAHGHRVYDMLDSTVMEDGAYIYLGHMNAVDSLAVYPPSPIHYPGETYDLAGLGSVFRGRNLIYSNGGSEICK